MAIYMYDAENIEFKFSDSLTLFWTGPGAPYIGQVAKKLARLTLPFVSENSETW